MVRYNNTTYTIGVGDTMPIIHEGGVKGSANPTYITRILGFNHDKLAGDTTKTAGISFEFAEGVTYARMNSTASNIGGWVTTDTAYTYLNSNRNTGSQGLSGMLESQNQGLKIATVSKEYINTWNTGAKGTSNDDMWLLACSEIWNNGINGFPYGVARVSEGAQYKYYKKINATHNIYNAKIVKQVNGTNMSWWLRSPCCDSNGGYALASITNGGYGNGANEAYSYAPGFCI